MLKAWRSRIMIFLAVLGPGFITANVDNDAGGIYTYSQAGARWGYLPLWTLIPITIALILLQEMCSRWGAVTGKVLFALIREEFGSPFPGDGSHARAHLLYQNQCDGDGNEGPEGEIPPARTRLRIRVDAAGVVINVGGDEPRAEDGQEDHDPRAPGFQHRQVPSFVPQHGDNVVRGDHAGQAAMFIDHRQGEQIVF